MGKETATALPDNLEGAIAQLKKLTEQNTSLTEENAKAAAKAEKQNKVIAELNARITKLETAKQTGDNRPTIKLADKEYNVNSGSRVGAKVYSAQEISEDAEVAQYILDIEGQTILTPVEETEEGE